MSAPSDLGFMDRSYEGMGFVEFPGSARIECEFLAFQLFNGSLRVRCRSALDTYDRFWSAGAVRGRLAGRLPEGRSLTADGLLTLEASLKSEGSKPIVLATLHPSSIEISTPDAPPVAGLRFALTNLRLTGDDAYVESDSERHWAGREVRLNLGSRMVILRRRG